MNDVKKILKKLEDEIVDQMNLLSTLDPKDDEYVNVAKHVDDMVTQWNKTLETLKNSNDAEETVKSEKKKNFWENILTGAKIVCEVAVPVFMAVVCWDIEKDGTIRSKAFPQIGKFKI